MSDPQKPDSPYVGLVPFSAEDAEFFFGRQKDQRIIAANMRSSRLTLLYGPSGVGKSSVLHAGVMHSFRQEMFARKKDGCSPARIVVCFNDWRDNPVDDLRREIDLEMKTTFVDPDDKELPQISSSAGLADFLKAWTDWLGGQLLIVLDQFEEYFLYQQDAGEQSFVDQLAEVIDRDDLRVNFLISLREDALAKLDGLQELIPGLYENLLRIDHLDRRAAIEAIKGPIHVYNRRHTENGRTVDIEDQLVDSVVDQVRSGKTHLGHAGKGSLSESEEPRNAKESIEAPFLQMVMTRLWDQEMGLGSCTLRLNTLNDLGGASEITRTHLDCTMTSLSSAERDITVNIFDRLVTPSGTKIALAADELSIYAKLPQRQVTPVLDKLAGHGIRILRHVAPPPDKPNTPRYEIFHDVLGAAILDWRRRHVAERELENSRRRIRRLRNILVGAVAVISLMVVLSIYALVQKQRATEAEDEATKAKDDALQAAKDAKQAAVDANQSLAQSHILRGLGEIEKGNFSTGLSYFFAAYDVGQTKQHEPFPSSARNLIAGWSTHLGTPLLHDERVYAVAFSPDGNTVLTGSGSMDVDKRSGEARLWDAETGAPRGAPMNHEGEIEAVAFSPNGLIVLTGSDDGTARLWDAETGAPRSKPMRHEDEVEAVAFSPDGLIILTGSDDGTARLWDAETGAPRGQPMYHEIHVNAVAFSPDGETVLTGSDDRTARLWDVETGAPRGEPMKHEGYVKTVAFSPNGKTVLTGSDDGTARLWDVETGAPWGEPLKHEGEVRAVAFSPDGLTVLTGSWDDTARLWDAETGAPRGEPMNHESPVQVVAFSPDGKTVLTGSWDDTARLWDAVTGMARREPMYHEVLAFSPDGETILTGSDARTARLWDANTGAQRGEPTRHLDYVSAVAFSPNGKSVLTGSRDDTARLWDVETGAPWGEPMKHEGDVKTVAFSPDGKTVLTGSDDGTARLWDAETGAARGQPMDHGIDVNAVVFSPDGKTVLTGSHDGTARLWDVETGAPRGEPMKHEVQVRGPGFSPDGKSVPRGELMIYRYYVFAVAFSPDGETVLTGCGDQTARLWDAETGAPLGEPMKHEGSVLAVAFSPDGKTVLTGSEDRAARLWNPQTCAPRRQPMRHEDSVWAVAFSPDGKTVLTGSHDKTARLWDVETGAPRGEPMRHDGKIDAVAYSPNGKNILTVSEDSPARLWGVSLPALDDHDRLKLSVEVRTGLFFDEQGRLQRLTQADWLERWKELKALGGPCDIVR